MSDEKKPMNKTAVEVLNELLALPEDELNAKFDDHVEGDFGALLIKAGFFPQENDVMSELKFDDEAAFAAGMKNKAATVVGFPPTAASFADGAYWQWKQDRIAYDALKSEADKLAKWLEQVIEGPAKTMAEPKSVWYSTHSENVLKAYKEFTGEKTFKANDAVVSIDGIKLLKAKLTTDSSDGTK